MRVSLAILSPGSTFNLLVLHFTDTASNTTQPSLSENMTRACPKAETPVSIARHPNSVCSTSQRSLGSVSSPFFTSLRNKLSYTWLTSKIVISVLEILRVRFHRHKEHGATVWSQGLDTMIIMGPFQVGISCDSMILWKQIQRMPFAVLACWFSFIAS